MVLRTQLEVYHFNEEILTVGRYRTWTPSSHRQSVSREEFPRFLRRSPFPRWKRRLLPLRPLRQIPRQLDRAPAIQERQDLPRFHRAEQARPQGGARPAGAPHPRERPAGRDRRRAEGPRDGEQAPVAGGPLVPRRALRITRARGLIGGRATSPGISCAATRSAPSPVP